MLESEDWTSAINLGFDYDRCINLDYFGPEAQDAEAHETANFIQSTPPDGVHDPLLTKNLFLDEGLDDFNEVMDPQNITEKPKHVLNDTSFSSTAVYSQESTDAAPAFIEQNREPEKDFQEINIASILEEKTDDEEDGVTDDTNDSKTSEELIIGGGYRCGAYSNMELRPIHLGTSSSVKPGTALGTNNGQQRGRPRSYRKRSINVRYSDTPSTSTSSEMKASYSGNKKPRKYESNDSNDPSVKNAKAAKHNREKKKLEFQAMKERAERAELENKILKANLQREQFKYANLQQILTTYQSNLRQRKNIPSATVTTAKDYLECILPGQNAQTRQNLPQQAQSYQRTTTTTVHLPLPHFDEIGSNNSSDLNPADFNILDESFQMPDTAASGVSRSLSTSTSQQMQPRHDYNYDSSRNNFK